MRHGHAFRKLNRTTAHRESMFKTMVTQLIKHDSIKTTLPKVRSKSGPSLHPAHILDGRPRSCVVSQTIW